MNPFVTFREVMGQRIYRVETPAGFVHFVATDAFEHESEAVQAIKGPRVVVNKPLEDVELLGPAVYHPNPNIAVIPKSNPVVASMEAEAKDAVIVQGDVSPPEDDKLEE